MLRIRISPQRGGSEDQKKGGKEADDSGGRSLGTGQENEATMPVPLLADADIKIRSLKTGAQFCFKTDGRVAGTARDAIRTFMPAVGQKPIEPVRKKTATLRPRWAGRV